MVLFHHMTPCSLIDGYQHFGGTCCLFCEILLVLYALFYGVYCLAKIRGFSTCTVSSAVYSGVAEDSSLLVSNCVFGIQTFRKIVFPSSSRVTYFYTA
jgi:hypothetical protein